MYNLAVREFLGAKLRRLKWKSYLNNKVRFKHEVKKAGVWPLWLRHYQLTLAM